MSLLLDAFRLIAAYPIAFIYAFLALGHFAGCVIEARKRNRPMACVYGSMVPPYATLAVIHIGH